MMNKFVDGRPVVTWRNFLKVSLLWKSHGVLLDSRPNNLISVLGKC